MFDFAVVGAGFAGSVTARRLADAGYRVIVIDRRPHIGGNAYDHLDEAGVLVHRYGPHIFHTNAPRIVDFLSRFTDWRPYEHRVLASVHGRLVPFPINVDTLNALYGLQLDEEGARAFLARQAEPVDHPKTSEEVVVGAVGRELYETFFRGYTRKQWALDPSELDASVAARVPARCNHDDRYFLDEFQVMPRRGYTVLFQHLLDHPSISVLLNTAWHDVRGVIPHRFLVYTGPIDEFYDYRFGRLPYRSLQFRFETHPCERYQAAPVINYPLDHDYTRVTEFKQLTGQVTPATTVVYEYPTDEGDPYYPIPRPANAELYQRYRGLAQAESGTWFIGRLATYKYYNMDQVVAQALTTSDRILEQLGARHADTPVGRRRVHDESRPRPVHRSASAQSA